MSQVSRIIREYFNFPHAAGIQKAFVDWLKDDSKSEEKEKDDTFRKLWDELDAEPDETTEFSYIRMRDRLFSVPESAIAKPVVPLRRRLLRYAAAWLVPLITFAGAYLYVKNTQPAAQSVELVECFVPNGEIRQITLPDSSVVQINSGSVLIYPKDFSGNTRSIYLNGEATFTVKRREAQPFIVKTSDMDVEALGTVFNVSSYHSDKSSSATLKTGKVAVRLKNERAGEAASFILKPDEQLTFDRTTGATKLTNVQVENVLAWHKGHLLAEHLSIEDISKILERKYDVTIYISSAKYEGQYITAKFRHNESLDESLSIIRQLIPGMKYTIDENKVYIY